MPGMMQLDVPPYDISDISNPWVSDQNIYTLDPWIYELGPHKADKSVHLHRLVRPEPAYAGH